MVSIDGLGITTPLTAVHHKPGQRVQSLSIAIGYRLLLL